VKLPFNKNFKFFFDANREAWNKKTKIHTLSELYNVDGFKRGLTSLYDIELKDLGDVTGKKILHLQCHFGLDTLSLARMGAVVTGVDFSEVALEYAIGISKEVNLEANFVEANVYDLLDIINDRFDVVFCSYGCICWLPDLFEWAKIVHKLLLPGGFFYIVDFHPVLNMLDCLLSDTKRSYFNTGEPFTRKWRGTYANYTDGIETVEYNWNHSLHEIFQALNENGLIIKQFYEHSCFPAKWFPNLVKGDDRMFRVKDHENEYPLLFSIKAIKY
jgi:SAM-dependent methyltransferase